MRNKCNDIKEKLFITDDDNKYFEQLEITRHSPRNVQFYDADPKNVEKYILRSSRAYRGNVKFDK